MEVNRSNSGQLRKVSKAQNGRIIARCGELKKMADAIRKEKGDE